MGSCVSKPKDEDAKRSREIDKTLQEVGSGNINICPHPADGAAG